MLCSLVSAGTVCLATNHFTAVCLFSKPLNRCDAERDLVVIQPGDISFVWGFAE